MNFGEWISYGLLFAGARAADVAQASPQASAREARLLRALWWDLLGAVDHVAGERCGTWPDGTTQGRCRGCWAGKSMFGRRPLGGLS